MLWIILAAIGVVVMMVVILNNNFKKFQMKVSEWAQGLTEFVTGVNMGAGTRPGDPGVQVAAEIILRNVRFLQVHKILKGAAPGDMKEILDTSWLERYNFVMLERSVPIGLLQEAFEEAGVDTDGMDEDEMIKMMPPLYCECADVIQTTCGDEDGSVWYADYKTEPIIINLEDDE